MTCQLGRVTSFGWVDFIMVAGRNDFDLNSDADSTNAAARALTDRLWSVKNNAVITEVCDVKPAIVPDGEHGL